MSRAESPALPEDARLVGLREALLADKDTKAKKAGDAWGPHWQTGYNQGVIDAIAAVAEMVQEAEAKHSIGILDNIIGLVEDHQYPPDALVNACKAQRAVLALKADRPKRRGSR